MFPEGFSPCQRFPLCRRAKLQLEKLKFLDAAAKRFSSSVCCARQTQPSACRLRQKLPIAKSTFKALWLVLKPQVQGGKQEKVKWCYIVKSWRWTWPHTGGAVCIFTHHHCSLDCGFHYVVMICLASTAYVSFWEANNAVRLNVLLFLTFNSSPCALGHEKNMTQRINVFTDTLLSLVRQEFLQPVGFFR